MAIIRSKIARQLLAEGGVSLDDAKMMAPPGEFLAYINPKEARMLRDAGGSGIMTPMGIPSFVDFGRAGSESYAASFGGPSPDTGPTSQEDSGFDTGDVNVGLRGGMPAFTPPGGTSNGGDDNFFNRIGRKIQDKRGDLAMSFINKSIAETMRGRLGLGKPGDINYVLDLLQNPDDRVYGLSNKEREIGEKLIDAGIKNEADIRGMTQTQFDDLFPGPNTGGGGDGDNEPIKKLRAPITEKKEEPKSEFDDILKFYGAKYARGGDVDYADLDLEEQAAVDRGEATAQMTTQERDEQGYGGGDADDLPTLPETGPIVFGGGPTRNVSGFGLLGRPTPTISKTTRDKMLQDFLNLDTGPKTLTSGQTNFNIKDVQPTSGYGGVRDVATGKALTDFLQEAPKDFLESLAPYGGPRRSNADGGEVRQEYGLGSIVKKATRAVKKVAKSPLGKAAILGGLTFGIPGTSFKGLSGLDAFKNLSTLQKAFLLGGTALSLSPFATEEEEEKLPTVANTDPEMTKFIDFYGGPTRFVAEGGDIDEAPIKMASAPSTFGELNQLSIDLFGRPYDQLNDSEQEILIEYFTKGKKQGIERATAARGGMMNPNDEMLDLGGNEMDLRGGGFVPLGEYEKKDDVPARLSKNEFVFTADAVRAAGGGSVDRGADIMYKTMKNLENKVA